MPSDTFKYIPVERLPMPGTCCICGSNQRGCIDFGITVEYFGAVLICVECIQDITNVEELALVSEAAVFDWKMRVGSANHQIAILKAASKEIKDDLVAMGNRIDDLVVNYSQHSRDSFKGSDPSFGDILENDRIVVRTSKTLD